MTIEQVQPSEAEQPVQEQNGDQGQPEEGVTVPAVASEARQPVQEQPHEAVSQEEERRRWEQSIRDRARHDARLEAQRLLEENRRQEQLAQEQKLIEEMDDEDYGRYVREKQAKEQQGAEQARQMLSQSFLQIQADVIASLSTEKARQELAERVKDQEFGSFADFHQAAMNIETDLKSEREAKQREKEVREAMTNSQRASDATFAAPQTGSGVPTAALNPKKMSTVRKMSEGWKRGPVH